MGVNKINLKLTTASFTRNVIMLYKSGISLRWGIIQNSIALVDTVFLRDGCSGS